MVLASSRAQNPSRPLGFLRFWASKSLRHTYFLFSPDLNNITGYQFFPNVARNVDRLRIPSPALN